MYYLKLSNKFDFKEFEFIENQNCCFLYNEEETIVSTPDKLLALEFKKYGFLEIEEPNILAGFDVRQYIASRPIEAFGVNMFFPNAF